MKGSILAIFLSVFSFSIASVAVFEGKTGGAKFELALQNYSDGVCIGTYFNTVNNEPIELIGRLTNDSLLLKDSEDLFSIRSDNFSFQNQTTVFITLDSNSPSSKTTLKLKGKLNDYDSQTINELEVIQNESTADLYAKAIISNKEGDYAHVSRVKFFSKETGEIVQEIKLFGMQANTNCVYVNDYNFDGYSDFSIVTGYGAGANVFSEYYLYDINVQSFSLSEIEGTSLEFDQKEKIVYEHSQCCAGNYHSTASYRVVDNKLELISQKCFKYDEETEDFIEDDCE